MLSPLTWKIPAVLVVIIVLQFGWNKLQGMRLDAVKAENVTLAGALDYKDDQLKAIEEDRKEEGLAREKLKKRKKATVKYADRPASDLLNAMLEQLQGRQ